MSDAIISEDLTIEGDVVAKNSRIEIKGRITGDVTAKTVDLMSGGQIVGHVQAEDVIFRGQLKGKVACTDLELHDTAVMHSDVTAKHLTSTKGAKVSGAMKIEG